MDLITRHRNLTVLLVALFLQVLGLAVQVKRPTDQGPTRLVRVWGVHLITPLEDGVSHAQHWVRSLWRNYFYLRDVRRENERLQEENLRLRLDQVRMAEDAGQAQRLQALLRFKESFVSETVAAQVIGSSGSESSRLIYIDKGSKDGVRPDMAVISPTGIVGKVIHVFGAYSQVLEINDQSSGVGAMLERSRLQGILKGTPAGEVMVHYIMADESVAAGEMVVTSGGDRVFPKGLPIGRVVQVSPGPDTFLNIRIKPAARLDRVEEVLVITKIDQREPELIPEAPMRAADILAQRLPSVPVKPPDAAAVASPGSAGAPAAAILPAAVPPGASGNKPVAGLAPAAKPVPAGAKPAVAPSKPANAVPQPSAIQSVPPARTATGTAPISRSAPGTPSVRADATAASNPAKTVKSAASPVPPSPQPAKTASTASIAPGAPSKPKPSPSRPESPTPEAR